MHQFFTTPQAPLGVLSQRNQFMELMKFIASFFVVFIHAPFPGSFGSFLYSMGQFAVPMFFMITGYFNFGATDAQVRRRAKHIFRLFLTGALIRVILSCAAVELRGGSTVAYLISYIPEPDEIIRLLVLHRPPYTGHLWFLVGMLACYGIFGAVVRFQGETSRNYKPFYCLSLSAFAVYFAVEVVGPVASPEGSGLTGYNGWFLGLSMFGIGLFMRQYQQRLTQAFGLTGKKIILWLLAGLAVTVIQWYGVSGQPLFGILIFVFSLMLLMIRFPKLIPTPGADRFFSALGKLSMWIYLVHLPLLTFYGQIFQSTLQNLLGAKEPWLYPLLLAAASLVLSLVLYLLAPLGRRLQKAVGKQ